VIAFTLFGQPSWPETQIDQDAARVRADLDRLKSLIESAPSGPAAR